MRLLLAILIACATVPAFTALDAAAQATCRQKCMDEENACLKRTGNKPQCGSRAQTCASKCK